MQVTAGRAECLGEPMAPRTFALLSVEATSEDLMVVKCQMGSRLWPLQTVVYGTVSALWREAN